MCHPDYPAHMCAYVVAVGQRLIDARLEAGTRWVRPDPDSELHQALMMGWDPQHDVVQP